MKEREREHDPYWSDDILLGEIPLSQGATLVRLRLHHSEESYDRRSIAERGYAASGGSLGGGAHRQPVHPPKWRYADFHIPGSREVAPRDLESQNTPTILFTHTKTKFSIGLIAKKSSKT